MSRPAFVAILAQVFLVSSSRGEALLIPGTFYIHASMEDRSLGGTLPPGTWTDPQGQTLQSHGGNSNKKGIRFTSFD